MESRLILARTDQRLIDTLLGHKTGGMGSVYFSGYSLTRRDDPQNVVPPPSSIPFGTFSGKLEQGPPID
jgi:hypothetical protein